MTEASIPGLPATDDALAPMQAAGTAVPFERRSETPLAAGRPAIRICHAPEKTLGACRNLATSASRGEFVAMFDDDDLYGPKYLSEAVAVLQTTGAAMVTKLEYIWLDGALGIFRFSRPRDEWDHERLQITTEQAYGLAGIALDSLRLAERVRHPG